MIPNTQTLIGLAVLLLAGCSSSNPDVSDPPKTADVAAGPGMVTFYLEGMNQRLKIL